MPASASRTSSCPLGYKGEYIKQYFNDYNIRNTDFTVDLQQRRRHPPSREIEDWRVTLCDTGQETLKGGRLEARGPLHRYRPLHGHLR